jgi:hypothetical protein
MIAGSFDRIAAESARDHEIARRVGLARRPGVEAATNLTRPPRTTSIQWLLHPAE